MHLNALLSLIQTVFSVFALFYSYRIVIDELGVEQLGYWALLVSVVALTRIAELGLSGSLLKYVASYIARKEFASAKLAVDSATISIALLVGAVMLISYVPINSIIYFILENENMHLHTSSFLIFSFAASWLAAIAGVSKLALEGCQRYDLSTSASILSIIVFVAGIIILIPKFKLHGLAYSIILQNLTLFLICRWYLCFSEIKTRFIPSSFSFEIWKHILFYGLNFQAMSILKIMLEPLTKSMLGKFGSIEFIGYYELASKFATQMRRLIATMNQVVIPKVSATEASSPMDLAALYKKNYAVVNFISIFFYSALVCAIPLLETLWFGERSPIFETIAVLAIFAFFVNTLSIPAYMINLGTGDIKQNLRSHIVMAAVNLSTGIPLGYFMGGIGVVFAWALALVIGTLPITMPFHKKYDIPQTSLVRKADILGGVGCLLGVVIGWAIFNYFDYYDNFWRAAAVTAVSIAIFVLIPMWLHPTRRFTQKRVALVAKTISSKLG